MNIVKLIVSIVIVLILGVSGSYFTMPNIEGWYAGLNKPWFTPPNWLFGPMWTTLYILIGIVLYICWENSFWNNKILMTVFIIQLALNFLWSPLFFGLKNPLLGLLDIIALDIAVIATIILLFSYSKTASILMLPYLAWILTASLLNLYIYILNP